MIANIALYSGTPKAISIQEPLKSWFLGFLILILLTGCTYSNFYSFSVPPNSTRLAETMVFVKRSDLLQLEDQRTFRELIGYGIKDQDIGDTSVALGRIICCGGPAEQGNNLRFYVPPNIKVELGDIVEISGGAQPSSSVPYPKPNTVLKVRQTAKSGRKHCRWTPEDPNLWGRILYCDGIEKEGWIQNTGLDKAWMKK